MIWVVLLILTFSDGSIVEKKDVTATSMKECVAITQQWKAEMREKYKFNLNKRDGPQPSTFIVGCNAEKAPS